MKKNLWVLFSLLFIIGHLSLVSPAFAQVTQEWQNLEPNRCVSQGDVATLQGFECVFINITRILTPLAGLALFIMLLVGAFKYLTAGGEAKKAQEASKTITYAIVGLVLFLGIWFILTLIRTITGVDVTQFIIPGP